MRAHSLSGLAAVATAALVSVALFCAGCLQELPLGDKYINEAVGFLRVRNTSTQASYIITAFELRDTSGKTVRTWEGLALEMGETWTGDLDLEGSFTLYCTVYNQDEKTTGTFNHGPVAIKLHDVIDSEITGEVYLSSFDTDDDGFSDFWEQANGFKPNYKADGGMVYVNTTTGKDDQGLGTAASPYKSLAKGIWKAKFGITDDARTVMADGEFSVATEGTADPDTSVIHITDTGLRAVTIKGKNASSSITAPGTKRAIYLGRGTKLTLENITIQNGWAYRGGGVYVDRAALVLGAGAVIQGCKNGGGVFAFGGASVVMESGSLIGGTTDAQANVSAFGAGITVYDGSSLVMKGGSKIQGNDLDQGGAVFADLGSHVVMLKDGENRAEITGNKPIGSSWDGFGPGGGVRLARKSTMIMEEGLISGNSNIRGGGGGVYVGGESELDMQGGTISGNSAVTTIVSDNAATITYIGNGGGVYVDTGGIFNMSGEAIIAGNTATGKGGGVYVDGGKFFKTGGTVYGSDAFEEDKNMAETSESQKGHAFFFMPDGPDDNTALGPVTFPITL